MFLGKTLFILGKNIVKGYMFVLIPSIAESFLFSFGDTSRSHLSPTTTISSTSIRSDSFSTTEDFTAQLPPPPADPYAPPPVGTPVVPPGIPILPPILPPIVLDGIESIPTLPRIDGIGGVIGAGNRMVLFNRYRLQFQEGEGFYRAQIPDTDNPGSFITDEEHKYYWLPDGSLLRTNNDGTGGQILSMNAAGTEQLPARAALGTDHELIAWGRTLASLGGLIPVNNGATYARGGNADNGEHILVPGSTGLVHRLEGPAGPAQTFMWRAARNEHSEAIPAPTTSEITIARALRALNLRPRRRNEVIPGGTGVTNITYRDNQWVAIPSGTGTPTGVFEVWGVLRSSGDVDIRAINTNDLNPTNHYEPAERSDYQETMSIPRVISIEWNPSTGESAHYVRLARRGTRAELDALPADDRYRWYRMQILEADGRSRYFTRFGTSNLWELTNVGGTFAWRLVAGTTPAGIAI